MSDISMEREIDFRAGKTYPPDNGPKDEKFFADSLFWAMRTRDEESFDVADVRDDLRAAFDRKDVRSRMEVATAAATGWTRLAEAGALNFAHLYAVANVLGCAAKPTALGEDFEPEMDPEKLRAGIDAALAKEWEKVQTAIEELTKNPNVLGLAASGDAAALREHLEKLKAAAAASPPAAPVTPAPVPPAAPAERQKRGFWPFKRTSSAAASEAQAADPPTAQDASASRAAPSPLREELLELCSMGGSPLMLAVDFGYIECVEALIEAAKADGADTLQAMLSQKGRDVYRSSNACITAVICDRFDILLALISAGADIRIPVANPGDFSFSPKISALQMLLILVSDGVEGGVQALKKVLDILAQDPDFDVNGPVVHKPSRTRSRRRTSADFDAAGDEGHEDGAEGEGPHSEGEGEEEEDAPWADDLAGDEDGDDDDIRNMRAMMMERMMHRMWGEHDYEEETVPTMLDVAARAAASRGAGVDVIKILIAAGAKPSAKTLVEAVRSVNDSYDGGENGLQMAAGLAAFTALLDAADDINAATPRSKTTPLHEAAYLGSLPAAKMLLERKALTTVRNDDDKTPMQLAEEHDHREMVDLLTRQHLLRRLLSGGGSSARRRQAAAAETDELPDDARCVICCSARKEVIAAPCGHRTTCKRCTKVLLTRPAKERNCPVCRERMDSYVLAVYDV